MMPDMPYMYYKLPRRVKYTGPRSIGWLTILTLMYEIKLPDFELALKKSQNVSSFLLELTG